MGNNEITIIYNNKYIKDDLLKIFGLEFVKNNKNKCKIIYENKEYKLEEYININIKNNKKDKIEIKLKGINSITNMSYMFYECKSLFSLPDISKWNTSNVTNMCHMFYNCSSISSLPILQWNTSNATDMSYMFSGLFFFIIIT